MTARESRARRGMLTAEYLELARACEAEGRCDASWANLEAAHIVGQPYTLAHVRSHWAMMMFARRLGPARASGSAVAHHRSRLVHVAVGACREFGSGRY